MHVKGLPGTFTPGTIISTKTGLTVSYAELLADLSEVQVVYVGEQHTNPHHHQIQLKVIKALVRSDPSLTVGMEMFDRTYQPVLDLWSAGKLDQQIFLQRVHWYANWRFNFELYGDILYFVREKNLKLVGLNIPFHIPPKIATGGIESLSPAEKSYLPEKIDTSNPRHRDYVARVFERHHVKGRENFGFFYEAQCVWEDAMAESVAQISRERKTVVLVGNGHIIYKFGIPERAYRRTQSNYRTIYLVGAGRSAERSYADYLWLTPPRKDPPKGKMPG
ncbi:ChaN family lipoprotein [Thermodesulfobacteriota bacterium]